MFDYLARSRGLWSELHGEPRAYERDVTVADVFTVRGGEVVHMQAYADPREALGTEAG